MRESLRLQRLLLIMLSAFVCTISAEDEEKVVTGLDAIGWTSNRDSSNQYHDQVQMQWKTVMLAN